MSSSLLYTCLKFGSASMLREHGAQRPTVFELLNHVHALRGSRPRFTYNIPPKQPPVSPRASQGPLQTLSPNIATPPPSNPLDDLVVFKSRGQSSTPPTRNAGTEARDKVLEAIAPMRRGRPVHSPAAPSPPPSPRKERDRNGTTNFSLDMKFGAEEDKAWRGVRGHKSGMASIGGGTTVNLNSGDAWGLGSKDGRKEPGMKDKLELPGFDSDFSTSFNKGFGDAFDPSKFPAPSPSPSKPSSLAQAIPSRPTPSPGLSGSPSKKRDAFDGLGIIPSQAPVQTLGDARRARTGVATTGAASTSTGQFLNALGAGIGSSFTTYRPPSSPSPNLRPSSRPQSPAIQPAPSRGKPTRPVELSVEERFPSLEDLDRTFASPYASQATSSSILHSTSQPSFTERAPERLPERPPTNAARPPSRTTANLTGGVRTGNLLGIPSSGTSNGADRGSAKHDGVRSQHVTGVAMRESRIGHSRTSTIGETPQEQSKYPVRRSGTVSYHPRPIQPRRHRSSMSIKQTAASSASPAPATLPSASDNYHSPPALPPRPSPKSAEQRDWLTGVSDDEAQTISAPHAVLRDSPSKRASFIERSPIQFEKPLEAENVVPVEADFDRERERQRDVDQRAEREKELERRKLEEQTRERGRFAGVTRLPTGDRSRRHDTGRQSPTKAAKTFIANTSTGMGGPFGGLQLPGMSTGKKVPPPLSSSPSGLTDNWSPVASPTRETTRRISSSSEDEGPEDINGYIPNSGISERMKALGVANEESPRESRPQERKRHANKGRQTSVHDLVDLWGGNTQEKVTSPTKLADKRRSAIVTSSSMMKPSQSFEPSLSLASPPLVSPTPIAPSPTTITSRALPRPPSAQQVRKQTTATTGSNTGLPPLVSPAPPPVMSSSTSTGRTRPQSMFINPVAKTAPLESHASSSIPSKDREQTESSLAGTKQRRNTRRTSISDMVHRYESITGTTKQGPGPPTVAPKPAPLSVKAVSSESSSTGAPSPSAAASRFPQLSPPSSPKLSKSSLVVPEDPEPARRGFLQGRRSPSPAARTASPRPLPGLAKSSFDRASGARPELTPKRPPVERQTTAPPPPSPADEEQPPTGEDSTLR